MMENKKYILVNIEPEKSCYVWVCKICGAMVNNTKPHDAFHESIKRVKRKNGDKK